MKLDVSYIKSQIKLFKKYNSYYHLKIYCNLIKLYWQYRNCYSYWFDFIFENTNFHKYSYYHEMFIFKYVYKRFGQQLKLFTISDPFVNAECVFRYLWYFHYYMSEREIVESIKRICEWAMIVKNYKILHRIKRINHLLMIIKSHIKNESLLIKIESIITLYRL